MTENTFTPGAAHRGMREIHDTPTTKRFNTRADAHRLAEQMPLTSEALIEQSLFDAAQTLATQHGKALTRTTNGYRVSGHGTTRHYIDLHDAAEFVRSSHKTTTNSKSPTGQGEQP